MKNKNLNGQELLAFIDQVGVWLKDNKQDIVASSSEGEESSAPKIEQETQIENKNSGFEHTNESFFNLYKKRLEQLHEEKRIEHHYRGYYVVIDNETGMGINEFRISDSTAQYVMGPGHGSLEYCFSNKHSEFKFLEKKIDDILRQYK